MKLGRRLALGSGVVALIAALLLVLWPSPIDPVVVDLPDALPLEGVWAPNEALHGAERIGPFPTGPEDVAIAPDGTVYTGTADGQIHRIQPDGTVEPFVHTGGRPLGMDLHPDGRLIVGDTERGLLAVSPAGEIEVLAVEAGGVPFRFTDDVDVSRGGVIYFTDASSRWGTHEYMFDLLEGRAHGRFMRYDPDTGQVEVLLDDLRFANGVAISSDERFVLVNETYGHRVHRYWLTGARAGTSEVLLDGLPGFPDGISCDGTGSCWLAMFTIRNPAASFLAPRPWARALVAKLPRSLWPKPAMYGLVAEVSEAEGRVVRTLQDPDGSHVYNVTSAEVAGEWLYMGTLLGDRVSRVRI